TTRLNLVMVLGSRFQVLQLNPVVSASPRNVGVLRGFNLFRTIPDARGRSLVRPPGQPCRGRVHALDRRPANYVDCVVDVAGMFLRILVLTFLRIRIRVLLIRLSSSSSQRKASCCCEYPECFHTTLL